MFDDEITSAAVALLDHCKAKALTLATAESCTGGLVAAALSEISGSSQRPFDSTPAAFANLL